MSSQQGPTRSGNTFIDSLVPYRVQIAYGLIAVGLALEAIPIVGWIRHRWDAAAVLIWGAVLAQLTLGIGLVFAFFYPRETDADTEADRLRTMLLLFAGCAGLATALFGLVLPFSTTEYRDVFSGGLEKWRKNGWMLFRVTAALLGGLFLIFAGLQLARTWERSKTSMRRLMYGYNAIFTSILLVLILLLVNVLAYAPVRPFTLFAHTGDWTQSRLYSLSDSTTSFLRELREPVKIIVLLSGNDRLSSEVETLLTNCRAVNPQINWELVSRDFNQQELLDLINKYNLPDPMGLLVLYGTEPNISHEFIKRADLFTLPSQDPRDRAASERFIFKGEGALMKSLRYLAEGKKRATIYFTQGHGEMDSGQQIMFQPERSTWSLSRLRTELESRNYEMKTLKIDRDLKQIPEDADVLFVAGPTEKWPDNGVKALRDYLNGTGRAKPGKAIVCLGIVGEGSAMGQIGIESVLAEFNVRMGNERLLALVRLVSPPNPTFILASTSRNSSNPVARAFSREGGSATVFVLPDARTVSAAADNPNAPGRWTVEPLLLAIDDQDVVGEPNLKASISDVVNDLRRDAAQRNKRLLHSPSIGVAVSASKSNMPQDFAHAGLNKEGEPRLIVFGDARWIGDPIMTTRFGTAHQNMITSGLSWLRGQAEIGSGPEDTDKERVAYQPAVPPGSGLRVLFLPGVLLIVAVVTMGLGVWVVRRR
jgi:hypothetical protein